LDFLGFPWILSFESGLINGLRRIFAVGIFLPPPWRETPQNRGRRLADAEVGFGHGDQPNLVSDFPQ
jgi:hypothetical protein